MELINVYEIVLSFVYSGVQWTMARSE